MTIIKVLFFWGIQKKFFEVAYLPAFFASNVFYNIHQKAFEKLIK